jgi:hypothetical protein
VTLAIFTPGAKVLPPSVERKIHSDRCGGRPVQCGPVTASFSATTYRAPVAGLTIGVAPMNCWNEQPLGGLQEPGGVGQFPGRAAVGGVGDRQPQEHLERPDIEINGEVVPGGVEVIA